MAGLVRYPCPLGEGRFAQLDLPSDLTEADVARIIAVLRTLPVPREPAVVLPARGEE